MATKCLFAYPIHSDMAAASYSGGSWEATLPLTNLQDERLAKVARATDATLASTKFDCDLGANQYIWAVAMPKHNMTRDGLYRVRGFFEVPIIDWSTVGDGSWTDVGTPTRAAAATHVEGIPLDRIGDDDGAATEETWREISFTGDGLKGITFLIKKGDSYASHRVYLQDVDAPATRLDVNIDFTGATPVVTATGATGVIESVTAFGSGFRVVCSSLAVVAANENRLYVSPASGAAADTAEIYIGDIQAWDAVGTTQHDTGWAKAYPVIYPAGMPLWIDPGTWDGYLNQPDYDAGNTFGWTQVLSSPTLARYWRVELDDTANPDGYVEAGRMIIASGYQPLLNFITGATLGYTSSSSSKETDGGAMYFNERAQRRVLNCAFANIPEDEALVHFLEITRFFGTTRQMLFVYNCEDMDHMHRRAFPCTIHQLSPLVILSGSYMGQPFQLREAL